MLSKRDKLLIQPWDERRFKDHRTKVKFALPAIDNMPPSERKHVTVKLKKNQKEEDRKIKIQKENFNLLQRLTVIMNVNRLDNHWEKPLPNFHRKVGLYCSKESLNRKLTEIESNNKAKELGSDIGSKTKCFACHFNKIKGEEYAKPKNNLSKNPYQCY